MRTWRQILADPKFSAYTSPMYLAITAGGNTTSNLYNLIFGASAIDAFNQYTNELTRRLISRGITSNAGFSTDAEYQFRWLQIFNKIHETQDEYGDLIRFQQEIITNASLKEDLKTTNKNVIKYNDTPQIANDFSGDQYTSTITSTTSENISPVGTLADKLDVARKALNDLYDRWVNLFSTFFIYNYDIEDNDSPFIPPVYPETELYKHHFRMTLEYLDNTYEVRWIETDKYPEEYTLEAYPAIGDWQGLNIGNAVATNKVDSYMSNVYIVNCFDNAERTAVELFDTNDESFSMNISSFTDHCVKI